MERAPVMYASLKAGRIVTLPEEDTLADALAGGIGASNHYTFEMVRRYVDDALLVSEEEIADAVAFMLHEHRLVVEGAGAVGVAALRSGKAATLGKRAAVVLSGQNIDTRLLLRLAGEWQDSSKR
jgi:threonine dehydratase